MSRDGKVALRSKFRGADERYLHMKLKWCEVVTAALLEVGMTNRMVWIISPCWLKSKQQIFWSVFGVNGPEILLSQQMTMSSPIPSLTPSPNI